jgi:hypothetical protein
MAENDLNRTTVVLGGARIAIEDSVDGGGREHD